MSLIINGSQKTAVYANHTQMDFVYVNGTKAYSRLTGNYTGNSLINNGTVVNHGLEVSAGQIRARSNTNVSSNLLGIVGGNLENGVTAAPPGGSPTGLLAMAIQTSSTSGIRIGVYSSTDVGTLWSPWISYSPLTGFGGGGVSQVMTADSSQTWQLITIGFDINISVKYPSGGSYISAPTNITVG